jgi:hypothetical protein
MNRRRLPVAELTARIKDDSPLLRKFEMALLDRGRMTKQDAIIEAITIWVASPIDGAGFGRLTDTEKSVLKAVLSILRNEHIDGTDPRHVKYNLLGLGSRR